MILVVLIMFLIGFGLGIIVGKQEELRKNTIREKDKELQIHKNLCHDQEERIKKLMNEDRS